MLSASLISLETQTTDIHIFLYLQLTVYILAV